jgi:hypothetical protein
MTAFDFKPGMQEQLTLFTDSPDTGDPECLCSYCSELIEEDDMPIRFFVPESEKYPHGAEYRLHEKCAQLVVDWASAREASHDEDWLQEEEWKKYGPCCACSQEGTPENPVWNGIMLKLRGPSPGKGWGCFTCDLPLDGALAFICDRCLELGHERAPIKWVVEGLVANKGRAPIETCTEFFDHDLSKHHELSEEGFDG